MKTQNYTSKTRQALRSLVKSMKSQGIDVVSNERTRKKGESWGCTVFQGGRTIHKPKAKRVYNVSQKGKVFRKLTTTNNVEFKL